MQLLNCPGMTAWPAYNLSLCRHIPTGKKNNDLVGECRITHQQCRLYTLNHTSGVAWTVLCKILHYFTLLQKLSTAGLAKVLATYKGRLSSSQRVLMKFIAPQPPLPVVYYLCATVLLASLYTNYICLAWTNSVLSKSQFVWLKVMLITESR